MLLRGTTNLMMRQKKHLIQMDGYTLVILQRSMIMDMSKSLEEKEILITSGGKNMAPVEIEDHVKPHTLVGQICVVGDGKKFLSALIVLDGDGGAEKWAEENGVEYNISDMSKNSKVIDAIQGQIDEANSKVARVQQIKKFTLLENEWTDSSGELTPTLKLKRNVIAERYKNEIESMYEEA